VTASRTAPRIVRGLQHRAQALELRRAGHTYAAIGEQLGLSKAMAFKLVRQGMEEGRIAIGKAADQLRAEELSRLDGMLEAVWPKASKGELAAVDRVLKIGERRARLLGLDAPSQHAATDPQGNPAGPTEVRLVPGLDVSKLSDATLAELVMQLGPPEAFRA
jgi:hypothetical protein